uniref:IrrE N-terminal-like domain-containing protein n=1 Tax=Candidatus Kentrum sp. MB TaxID=2138164 RepID=A0A450XJP9_9GAMM|nr:MAG: protein of unknown function (DUF955) [Candidatus Kentron sp. MB]VFK29511.1 MAG: protein of unknown function (DUF955) [Candidatus Kentron sp. MB]VFK74811.1 MAG: protein of unknown function (DUF955) [Candidatus Kentron sp. MB]
MRGTSHNLSLFVIGLQPPSGIEFDAFLISAESHAAICVNSNKPFVRLHFSILHEIAHLLFDRDKGCEIDTWPENLYAEKIKHQDQPEFIANKFAQFFLIPYQWAMESAKRWPHINVNNAQGMLNEAQTSRSVMVNAICDFLRNERWGEYNSMSWALYREIEETLDEKHINSGKANFIEDIILGNRRHLLDTLNKNKDAYSHEIIGWIRNTLQLI